MNTRNRWITSILAFLAALGVYFVPKPDTKPLPTPTPTATATVTQTPEPSPSPTPTATPIPSPTVIVTGCDLPPGNGPQSGCQDHPENLEFREAVMEAQAKAFLFVVNGKVLDEISYTSFIAGKLREQGYCAIHSRAFSETSPKEEVWVKTSNEFSAHWDLVMGSGEPITFPASRCKRARF